MLHLRTDQPCPRVVIRDVVTPLMEQACTVMTRKGCAAFMKSYCTNLVAYMSCAQRAHILPR